MVEYKGLDLAQLHKKQLSGVQLHDFASKNQVALEQAFTTAAENTGTLQQCYSNLAYDLKTLPAAMQRFRSSGEMTLDIPLPPNSRYYGVTFSDVRVYLVGLPPPSGRDKTIKIAITKLGTSTFLDKHGKTQRFTHKDKSIDFNYDGSRNGRCQVLSTSDPLKLSANIKDWRLRYSPYGAWVINIQVPLKSLQLDKVTAVRFEFHVAYLSGAAGGTHSAFFNGLGCTSELKSRACTSGGGSQPPPPPPMAPPLPPPPPPAGCSSCATFADFDKCVKVVNHKCCDEPSEKCVGGVPATCNADCAAVLRPMMAACGKPGSFLLTKSYMAESRRHLQSALAKCAPPLKPCKSYGQFEALSTTRLFPTAWRPPLPPQPFCLFSRLRHPYVIHHEHDPFLCLCTGTAVSKACCTGGSKCVDGVPAACTGKCASVLVPTTTACTPFLKSKPYFKGFLTRLQTQTHKCLGGGH